MRSRPSRKEFKYRLELMVEELRKDILDGTYKPGDTLPSETALVEQYHLSNNSVRKGLDILVQEGRIVKKPRVGSVVAKAEQTDTITLGCSPSIERDIELSKIIERFQEDYPSIRVNTVTITSPNSFEYINTIRGYLENGMIDVMTLNNINFQEIVEKKYVDLFEPTLQNTSMYPFLNDAFTLANELYVQPLVFSPIVLGYNKEHFRDAELMEPDSSWTWDHVEKAAIQLTNKRDRHGLFFHILSENRWPVFLLQSGASFAFNQELSDPLDDPRLLDSIRLSGDLLHNREAFAHYLSEDSKDAGRLFAEGKISMTLLNYMSMNDFKYDDFEYDISPLPFIQQPITLINAIGLAVNRKSPKKQLASLLVDYFTSENIQLMIRENTLSIPAMKPVAESAQTDDLALNRPDSFALFKEIIPSFRLHKDLGLTVHGFKKLSHLLKMYWSDMIDELELLNKMKIELTSEDRLQP